MKFLNPPVCSISGRSNFVATMIVAVVLSSTVCGDEPLSPRDDVPGVKNFAQISPGLWRGAQPTPMGFVELKNRGVRTILNLRGERSDRRELEGTGLRHARIFCKPWHPEDEDVVRFLQLVRDPENQPVFIHCQHGVDRTGMMVAIYRVVEQDWTVDEALQEMRRFGAHAIFFKGIASYIKAMDRAALPREIEVAKPLKIETVR